MSRRKKTDHKIFKAGNDVQRKWNSSLLHKIRDLILTTGKKVRPW